MNKKSLLALLLALTLLLSGCNLVAKDPAVDAATPIVSLGDVVYTKAEVQNLVVNQINYLYQQYYMYYMYGLIQYMPDFTSKEYQAEVTDEVVEFLTHKAVELNKAKSLGLTLTAEEEAAVAAQTEEDWGTVLSNVQSYYFAGTTLTGDELNAALEASATDLGYSRTALEESNHENAVLDKLRAKTLESMPAVTDADYQAALDEKAAADKETYTTAGAYADAVINGTTVFYRPAGTRTVQHILVKFSDEDAASITDLTTRRDSAQTRVNELAATETDLAAMDAANAELTAAQTELDAVTEAAYAHLDETAATVIARAATEDFAALAVEFSGDKDANGNVNSPDGYVIANGMTRFDAPFVEAGMALQNVGDISDKVRGAYGYYIIKYVAEGAEGNVALDEVRSVIEPEVLETKQNEYYEAQVADWTAKSGVKVDRKAMDD